MLQVTGRSEKKMLCSSNQPECQSYQAKELDNISDESDVDERSEDAHGDYAPVDREIHVPQLKSRNICTTVTDIGLGKQWITLVKEQIKKCLWTTTRPFDRTNTWDRY